MSSQTIAPGLSQPNSATGERIIDRKTLLQRIWKARLSYVMLMPFLLPFIVFVIVPVIGSAYLSLTEYSGVPTTPPAFVGFNNFAKLVSLEIKELPRLYDENGAQMYQCGRKKLPESEVAAWEAEEGKTCEIAYQRAGEVLTDGYTEFSRITIFNKLYVLGAQDSRFWVAIVNTVIFVLISVAGKTVLGLVLAMALRKQNFVNLALRIVFFLPSVTASAAITVVWGWIFRGQSYGLINNFITRAGGEVIPFLNSADWTMPILLLMAVWGGMGYNMILFLAGLQNIPAEFYEAAAVDGATSQQRFWKITLPLLRPTFLYIIITGIIGAFQTFEAVYILFASSEGMGGVSDSGLMVVPYLYDEGFRLFNLGYSSAIAWVLFFIIFIFTLINLRVGRADEAY